MVYRSISGDMQMRALELLHEGLDIADVARLLNVSERSIYRWQHNLTTHGSTNPSSHFRGRPRLLSAAALEDLRTLIAESPSLYLDEIRDWLALFYDQPISLTALHDNLCELGLTTKIMQRAAAERDEDLRTAWRQDITVNFSADQLVFIDESSKDGRTIFRKYGRAAAGQPATQTVSLNRGQRYSILPALSLDGYMTVRVVEGSVDSTEFFDFIVEDVVRSQHLFMRTITNLYH